LTAVIGSQPYLEVQTAHDLTYGWGSRSFINSHYADDIRSEALDELVELVGSAPGISSVSATVQGGAIGRINEEATAYAGRQSAFDLSADSDWSDDMKKSMLAGQKALRKELVLLRKLRKRTSAAMR